MDKIIYALLFIGLIFVLAMFIKSFLCDNKRETTVSTALAIKQSKDGVGAIEHNNTSATIEECFMGANEVLIEYNIDFSMEKIMRNGYSK